MQRLEVSGAVRPLYGSLGVKGLVYELKKMERYLRVNLLGPGPHLMKKGFTGPRSHKSSETLCYSIIGILKNLTPLLLPRHNTFSGYGFRISKVVEHVASKE